MKLSATSVGSGQFGTVLLHGFLGSGKNLRTLAMRWVERDASRRFLLVDLRGHGVSGGDTDGCHLTDLAADVLETADAEGFDGPLSLVGHSLGGRVALAAFGRNPTRVASVAMLDISPSPIARELSHSGDVLSLLVRAPAHAPDRRTMRAWFLEHGLSAPLTDWLMMNLAERASSDGGGVTWRFDRAALERLHAQVNAEDLWPLALEAKAKLRCIYGDRSPYVSAADRTRLAALGAHVAGLSGAGHYVHVDALEALLDQLVTRWQ